MKNTIGAVIGIVLAVAVFAGPAQVRAEDSVKAQIEASNKLFAEAWGKKDAAGIAARYTADAQLFPTGSDPIKGNAAVQAFWKTAIDAGDGGAPKFTTFEAEQHGDTAIEVGQAEILDAKGKHVDTVKYIVIWKKIDGKWKMHRDIWNSNTPAK